MLIGITGRKRHGKDTVGAFLENNHGFYATHFAKPLKRACRDIFGFTFDQVYGDQKEIPDPRWDGLTPRAILQRFGTEVGRAIHPETWVRSTLTRVEDDADVCITDVRFPNEAQAIRDRGGYILKVTRPSRLAPYQRTTAWIAQWSHLAAKCWAWWHGEHPSETGVDLIEADYTLINDGNLYDLEDEVRAVEALLRDGLL